MEPSQPFGDAPCPHCGCLLRFESLDEGIRVSVAKVAATVAESSEVQSERPLYVCPQCKTRIPFGTETKPPPTRCPGCQRRLSIPTTLSKLPGHLAANASQ